MQAYLTWMTVRLMEMHRLLKPTGSIYLHCDHNGQRTTSKRLMDSAVFGAENFRSEITLEDALPLYRVDVQEIWAGKSTMITLFYYANSGRLVHMEPLIYGEYDRDSM